MDTVLLLPLLNLRKFMDAVLLVDICGCSPLQCLRVAWFSTGLPNNKDLSLNYIFWQSFLTI